MAQRPHGNNGWVARPGSSTASKAFLAGSKSLLKWTAPQEGRDAHLAGGVRRRQRVHGKVVSLFSGVKASCAQFPVGRPVVVGAPDGYEEGAKGACWVGERRTKLSLRRTDTPSKVHGC
ncbi:hypothetical protein CLCR_03179 [Cladophialophora carrionii]|uniref:Uncharacterized protein n=1 Tax=Cladophialophora carrionii TaxID=86049 RepID=A0A1C1D1T9_9EURO|nr:hypothetical protein CLCR_03179 [Cladophialophora carrionii]